MDKNQPLQGLLRTRLKALFQDDQAQATTEYILVLFIAVSLFMIVFTQLLKPMFSHLKTTLSQSLTNKLFSSSNLHQFPVSH